MKKLLWLPIVVLGVLVVLGWQQVNSLRYELAIKDITISNLMVSFKQVQNKPSEIKIITVEKLVPVETVVYETKTVYLDRTVEVLVPVDRRWTVFNKIENMSRASVMGFEDDYSTLTCLPTAQMVQKIWWTQGYQVSIALAWNHYYYGKYVTDAPDGHAGLLVETKEAWYFIDPLGWRVTKLFDERNN